MSALLPKLPTFDGKPHEWGSFIFQFRQHAKYHHWSAKEKVFFVVFFHTTLFHHIYISFVTTRQHSTNKQSMMDYNVRTLACIRTLEISYDNRTHNNAPKATGIGLVQCGTAIMWSIFFNFSQQTTHSSPVRPRNGVPIVRFKSVLLLSVQCCV